MALTDITDKILADANLKSEEIIREAHLEADRILEKAKSESDKLKEDILKKATLESSKRLKSAEISFNMKLKNAILEEKQVILGEAFNQAKKAIIGLTADEYRDFIKRIILAAVREGDEELVISETDKERLNEDFIHFVNTELKKAGKKGNLKLGFDKRSYSGFILKVHKIQIDCSLDAILNLTRPELQAELVNLLFG